MAKRKELLIIAYYYPPMGTIGTLRNYILSKELSKYFTKIHVITIKNRPFPMKDKLDISHVEMYPVNNYDYRVFNKGTAPNHVKRNVKIFTMISRTLDSYPFNLWFGEGGRIYINAALKKARAIIKENNISHIYSSFRPLADHYIVHKVKQEFPDLFWIADYRDLHVDPVRTNVYFPKMQHSLNKRLMSNANLLTTVSEGLEKNLKDYHPNRYVLFNGIYQLFEKLEEHQNEKFTICYTGSMYGENRNPEVLLKALKILIEEGKVDINKVQIKYAGKDFEDWKAWASKFQLNKILADCGYLTFKESFQLQRAAHINLLLTYTGKNYTGGLTGKLYEYLAAERPVMVIIRGEKDLEFESMINKLNAGTVLYSKEESVLGAKRFILNLFEQWKNDGDINLEMNKDVLKRYHWEEMIKNFIPRI